VTFELLIALDLHDGRVVRLRQGRFDEATVHGDDPVAVARTLVERGAEWLHVVDLDGARVGRPIHGSAIAAVVDAIGDLVSIEVGGGIRDDEAAGTLLDAGVRRVVVGTAALDEPAFVARLVARHGPERVAVAIDVRAGQAVGDAWQPMGTGVDASATLEGLAAAGADVFEVTAIDRDGTLGGPDLELLGRLVELRSGRIVASGGIRSIEDLVAVRKAGCSGAIVGRAVYEGAVDLAAAKRQLAEPVGT